MDRANKKINDRLMTNVTIERWLVVKFDEEDTVEAVPECWYNRQSMECYWPPKSFTGKQQTDYIKHSKRPESNWQRYPAAVLGSYDSLAVAIRKADKAKSTSDLSSACDEFPSSNYVRPSKKRKRPPLSDVESLSDTSSIRSDVDDDAYPDVTKLFSETDCRKRVQKSSKETEARRTLSSNEMAQGPQNSRNSVQPPPKEPRSKKNRSPLEKIRSPENYRKRFQLSPIDTKSAKRTRQSQEKSPSPQDYRKRFQSPPRLNKAGGNRSPDSENVGTKNQRLTVQSTSEKVKASTSKTPEFQVRLFKEIDSIQLKLNDLMDDVATLLKNRRLETEREMIPNDVPEIMHQFPLDEKSLYAVESWLNSKAEHKKILALELSHIGGSTAKEVTRRIMYRVFTNEVGSLYSWEGAKKKKPFKKLAISSTILNAVRLCKKTAESNEAEVIGHIKAWLVRCKDRLKNTSMKVKDNEVVAAPEKKSDEDERSADGRSQARREYNYEDGAWEKSQGDKNKEKSREEIERQDQTTGNSKETQVGEENRDLEKGTKPHNCAKGIFGVSMRSEERGSNFLKNYSDNERDIATDKYGEQD